MLLYDTLSRRNVEVVPIDDNTIKLYTCGLTVYSQPHIGNWVAYIYWDILVRALKNTGFEVIRVQNITDVGHLTSDEDAGEDKMLKGALKEGLTAWQIAEKYIEIADDEAYDQLSLIRPNYMPRATEYIPQQIKFVQELEKKGYTYVIEDGLYFDTSKLSSYGQLARLDVDGLQFGARVADTGKRNPTDFALWKFSDPSENRDMEWESPWGIGFPGWHLECSVMARELLGDQIDIHTGGIDHIPVHHTNEIAQTEAVTNKQFSALWMHANHIKVDGVKMSKSIGNVYTLNDIKSKGYDINAFKLLVMSKHYQTEGNFTWEILTASQNRLQGFRDFADLRFQTNENAFTQLENRFFTNAKNDIQTLINNNLDTPGVLKYLNEVIEHIEKSGGGIHSVDKVEFDSFLKFVDGLLGLNLLSSTDITDHQKSMLDQRHIARQNKNWQLSDNIRDELRGQGIAIKDVVYGESDSNQIWSRPLL